MYASLNRRTGMYAGPLNSTLPATTYYYRNDET